MKYDDQLAYEDTIHYLKLENKQLGHELREAKAKLNTGTIDEGCVGCCKVVDVAAKLQKELDSTIGQLVDSRGRCDYLSIEIESREAELFDLKTHLPSNFGSVVTEKDSMIRQLGNTIEELKDMNIEDLKELYDFHEGELEWFKDVISARDLTIESLTTMCQSSGTERNKLASTIKDLEAKIKSVRNGWFLACDDVQALEVTIEKQNQTLLHIKAELDAAKQFNPFNPALISGSMENISNVIDDHFTSCPTTDEWDGGIIELRSWIGRLSSTVETLEAELAARKEDSAVLMTVVEALRDWQADPINPRHMIERIRHITEDYRNAPDESNDASIDEPKEITVTVAWLELP